MGRLEGVKQALKSKGYDVNDIPKEVVEVMKEAMRRESLFEEVNMSLMPPNLMEALLPFQRSGVEFAIKRGGKALICDDMGLGKTIQGIAVAAYYMNEWPCLILAQASLKRNWRTEFIKWIPGIADHIKVIESAADFCGGEAHGGANNSSVSKNSDFGASTKTFGAAKFQTKSSPVAQVTIMAYDLAAKLAADGTLERRLSAINSSYASPSSSTHSSSTAKASSSKGGYFKVVIADESHMLKSVGAQRTKALVPILKRAHRTLLLSGTPALSRPSELFPQLRALDASIWPTLKGFGIRYCNAHDGPYGWDYTGNSNLIELNAVLTNTVMIRRLKDSVLTDMPEKIRKIIQIEKDQNMDPIMSSEYDNSGSIQERFLMMAQTEAILMDQELKQENAEKSNDVKRAKAPEPKINLNRENEDILALYREASVAKQDGVRHYIRKLVEEENAAASALPQRSSSSLFAPDYIEDAYCNSKQSSSNQPLRTGRKFLIFAHHIGMLDAISDELTRLGVLHMRIDGETSTKERDANVTNFQKNEKVRAAVLSLTCASTGLTLTASSLVVFAELYWNPGTLIQAEDRVHRLGQTAKFVELRYLFCKGTVDDLLWPLIERKLNVVGSAINGAKDSMALQGNKKSKITAINKPVAKTQSIELSLNGNEEEGDDDIIILGDDELATSTKTSKKGETKKTRQKTPKIERPTSITEPKGTKNESKGKLTPISRPMIGGIMGSFLQKSSSSSSVPKPPQNAPIYDVVVIDDDVEGVSQDSTMTPVFVGLEKKRQLDFSLEAEEEFAPAPKKSFSSPITTSNSSTTEMAPESSMEAEKIEEKSSLPSENKESSLTPSDRDTMSFEVELMEDDPFSYDKAPLQPPNTMPTLPPTTPKSESQLRLTKLSFLSPSGSGVRLGIKK